MKVLILTCNTGGGHNSTATAITDEFEKNGIECIRRDALEFVSKKFSGALCDAFVLMYRRFPVLWRGGYRGAEILDRPLHITRKIRNSITIPDSLKTKLSDFTRPYAPLLSDASSKLCVFVQQNGIDTVICTHPFAAIMTTFLKEIYMPDILTSFVATDYTCSPTVGDSFVDLYFIPHEGLRSEFENAGVPSDKIVASGIPVRKEFYSPARKKKALKVLGIPDGMRNVVLMSGSMGAGNMGRLVEKIYDSIPRDCMLTVVCGSNKELYDKVYKMDKRRINLIGFTDSMPMIMDSAELLITKPGGLTSTEGAVKHIPMLFLDIVGGCERRNIAYFIENGWAEGTERVSLLCRKCTEMLEDDLLLGTIRNRLQKEFDGNAAENIYRAVTEYKI